MTKTKQWLEEGDDHGFYLIENENRESITVQL